VILVDLSSSGSFLCAAKDLGEPRELSHSDNINHALGWN